MLHNLDDPGEAMTRLTPRRCIYSVHGGVELLSSNCSVAGVMDFQQGSESHRFTNLLYHSHSSPGTVLEVDMDHIPRTGIGRDDKGSMWFPDLSEAGNIERSNRNRPDKIV